MTPNVLWYKFDDSGNFNSGGRFNDIHIRQTLIKNIWNSTCPKEGVIQVNPFMDCLLSPNKTLAEAQICFADFRFYEEYAVKNMLTNLRIIEIKTNSVFQRDASGNVEMHQPVGDFQPITIFLESLQPGTNFICQRIAENENTICRLELKQDTSTTLHVFKDRFKKEVANLDFENPDQLQQQMDKAQLWLEAYMILRERTE